ncbi:MAG TPA: hypothetical protein DDW88_10950 [Treponema sp.]|nr:hypothetical protein [Treponema sp.]
MEDMYITKWEYCDAFHESELAALGQAGWEAYGTRNTTIVLKRPCGRIRLQEKKRSPEPSKNQGYER